MDLKGSLVNTHLRVYPSQYCTTFLKTLPDQEEIPVNILKLIGRNCKGNLNVEVDQQNKPQLNDRDLKNIKEISNFVEANTVEANTVPSDPKEIETDNDSGENTKSDKEKAMPNDKEKSGDTPEKQTGKDSEGDKVIDTEDATEVKTPEKEPKPFITTSDIDWLYSYLQKRKSEGDDVPYLHALLEEANLEMPENKVIKRNPQLEARCVKLRAQQEARAYRQMTKSVDNVRMRYPEDSISYQMKQLNRHLIAIAQFLLSIFAGFMFGFRGIDMMIGDLDFGFRLLLGVMCALIIALAELYFIAKKLNEELNIPETVQLGGPPKLSDEVQYRHLFSQGTGKEHQD